MVRNKGQKLKHLPLISHLFFPGSTSVLHFEFHFLSPHPGQHRGSGQGLWSVCGSSPLILHPLCTAPCSNLWCPWAAGPAGHGHLSLCDSPQVLQGNHALVPGATPPRPATPSLLFILLFKKIVFGTKPQNLLSPKKPQHGCRAQPNPTVAPWNRLCPAGAAPTSPQGSSCGSSLPAPHHQHLAEEVRRLQTTA